MSLCINPKCQNPDNPDNLLYCQSCQSELLLEGRYRLVSLLGEGGFAKTYEVSDRTNIPKVIKVLSKNEPKRVEQFQREAQILTRLNHPGVPQAEESFTFYPKNSQEPVYCLVMEKIEGENLEKWLENRGNRPISEKLAVDWLTQLAKTLHEVHQQQLFHRDIKPSNIMLNPDGGLVLIDFGIAREITGTYEQKQATGQVTKVVSDGYSPLEQVTGSAVPKSDFFALGRTFVHLLTGEHPLNLGDSYRHDIYTDELEDWRDKAPQISSILGDFIDQLMARPIQKRPADTQSILAQLAEIQQTLYPNKLSSTTSSQVVPIPNKPNFTLEHTLGSWDSEHFDPVGCLAISQDGEFLVSGNGNAIKAWNLKTGTEMYIVTEHQKGVLSLAISPDGQYFVSGSDDSSIKVWKLSTGELLRTFEDNHGSADKTLKVWDLNTRKEVNTISEHLNEVTAVVFSPDGQFLVSGSEDCTIKVWRIQSIISSSSLP